MTQDDMKDGWAIGIVEDGKGAPSSIRHYIVAIDERVEALKALEESLGRECQPATVTRVENRLLQLRHMTVGEVRVLGKHQHHDATVRRRTVVS